MIIIMDKENRQLTRKILYLLANKGYLLLVLPSAGSTRIPWNQTVKPASAHPAERFYPIRYCDGYPPRSALDTNSKTLDGEGILHGDCVAIRTS